MQFEGDFFPRRFHLFLINGEMVSQTLHDFPNQYFRRGRPGGDAERGDIRHPGKIDIASPLNQTGRGAFPLSHFRSEEHTSELQSLMRTSYAVFCLKKKKNKTRVYSQTLNNIKT